MTTQGKLESAAQSGAVNGRNHRLRARLECIHHVDQSGGPSGLAKLGDVGACAETTPVADENATSHAVVGRQFAERLQQSGTQTLTERVDRRIHHGDNTNTSLDSELSCHDSQFPPVIELTWTLHEDTRAVANNSVSLGAPLLSHIRPAKP